MGSYGISVTRVMAAWPRPTATTGPELARADLLPSTCVLATGKGDEVFETAQSLGEQLDAAGLDVLVDDRRRSSAGVKFKDYELVECALRPGCRSFAGRRRGGDPRACHGRRCHRRARRGSRLAPRRIPPRP